MNLGSHLRRTFVAGTFAAVPVVITVVAIYYVNRYTELLAPRVRGHEIPFLGLIIAVVAIYLLGLFVSTTVAKAILTRLDRLLDRLPILRSAYGAWKQVSLTHGAGIWDKVVLVEVETGQTATLGFTSGLPIEGAPDTLCVYIPSAPIPSTGRLYLVPRIHCQIIDIPVEEAFKHLLSGGNHIPAGLGAAVLRLNARKA